MSSRATPQCSPVTVYNTVTATVTATQMVAYPPPTITILEQDPAAVASSKASIDTDYVEFQSGLAPISNPKATTNTVFTETVRVSGYEATEVSNVGYSVFYKSKPPSDTGPSWTPAASIIAVVTTVTVLPHGQVATTAQHEIAANSSGPSAFSSPSAGWNNTHSNSSIVGTGTAASYGWGTGTAGSFPLGTGTAGSGARSSDGAASTVTFTNFVHTITQSVTVNATSAATSEYPQPAYGYGSLESSHGHDAMEKRQTCVWITATIGGQQVGWCNNWDGSTTLTYTSWETTSKWYKCPVVHGRY